MPEQPPQSPGAAPGKGSPFPWLAEGFAGASGLMALVGLVGSILGRPELGAMGRGLVPLAPLSAFLYLLLTAAVLILRLGRSGQGVRMGRTFSLVAAATCLLVTWGYGRGGALAETLDVHQVSPLTVACLAMAAASFLLGGSLPSPSPRRRQLAALAALGPIGLGGVVLLSYLGGAPLLYLTQSTPMSLPSAISSLLLGLALLVLDGTDVWPVAWFCATPSAGERRLAKGPLVAFLLLALAILVGGSLFLHGQLNRARAGAQEDLAHLAELRAGQIGNWYQERRGAAVQVLRSSMLQTQLQGFLAGSPLARSGQEVRNWLEGFRQDSMFQNLILFDAQGRVRLAVPDRGPHPGPEPQLQAALKARDLLARDLYRQDGAVRLDFWVPIGAGQGALLFRVDAASWLFPMIQALPVQSPSMEMLLVRREAGEVVFLNAVRQRKGTALTLRRSTTAPGTLPAAFSASGPDGLAAGLDYRNVPVLAARRPVPGTPWLIVAKVDAQEIFGPLRQRTWTTLAVLVGLVLLVAMAIGLMLGQQETGRMAGQLAQERRHKNLAARFEHVLRVANDAILLLDLDGHILEGNLRAQAYYGRTAEELRGLHLSELNADSEGGAPVDRLQELKRAGTLRYEAWHRRKDGSLFPVQGSSSLVELEGETIAMSIIQDISERRARTRDLERLSHLYAALSQVNQSIVWSRTREELFERICRVLVEFGEFRMAWIAGLEPGTEPLKVLSSHGDAEGYLEALEADGDESEVEHGPAGTAIREDRPCIYNDFLGVPEGLNWREAAARSGFKAAAAFPIHRDGAVCGAVAVYNAYEGCFGDKEVQLLMEAAVDVSFALDHLAGEEHRLEAERALRESLAFNKAMIETIPFGLDIVDEDGNLLYLNPALEAMVGAGALGDPCWRHYKDDQAQCPDCPLRQPIEVGRTTMSEVPGMLGGKWFQISHTGMLFRGRKAVLELFHDITERRRAEAERLELTAQLHQSQKMESLGSLAGGIAHDINNVLAAILSLASAHRENLDPATTLAHSLDTIEMACLRGRDVVKSLLYFARKGLGTMAPVDLNAVVIDLVQLLSRTTLQRIRLETALQDGLGPILGDSSSLSNAILNICVNAKDAMPDGGTLFLATRALPGGRIELSIRDTGHGMGPETLARAMEPFFTTKPAGKGTGLGLAMVFGTVKAMGGTVDLRSRPGQGTEVLLAFPALQEQPKDAPGAPTTAAAPAPRSGALRVLLVDDDELIRGSVAPMLTLLGHHVWTAAGGLEALALARSGLEVDLVVLDMNMPDLNGAETLRRLLLERPDQAVLMASGYNDHDMTQLLAGRPRVGSIQKPFQLSEFQAAIRALEL